MNPQIKTLIEQLESGEWEEVTHPNISNWNGILRIGIYNENDEISSTFFYRKKQTQTFNPELLEEKK
jgi:hypothetical protein